MNTLNLLINAMKEIESITCNPREYQPSYYTINHIARNVLEEIANSETFNTSYDDDQSEILDFITKQIQKNPNRMYKVSVTVDEE